jgi:membrane fusion protein, multidrug efflux system
VESAQAAIQSAQSGVRAAEAAVTRAEDELTRLTIHAPFAGLLESDTAELGSLMQPGTPCATIIQLDPIKLVGFVPEANVDRVIALGARRARAWPRGGNVMGRSAFVSRSADPQTRTFRVEITVPNADQSIRDGQTADILIQTEGTSAHLLPASAMTLSDDGRLGVRTVVDGIVAIRPRPHDPRHGQWRLADRACRGGRCHHRGAGIRDRRGTPVRVTYEELSQ